MAHCSTGAVCLPGNSRDRHCLQHSSLTLHGAPRRCAQSLGGRKAFISASKPGRMELNLVSRILLQRHRAARWQGDGAGTEGCSSIPTRHVPKGGGPTRGPEQ